MYIQLLPCEYNFKNYEAQYNHTSENSWPILSFEVTDNYKKVYLQDIFYIRKLTLTWTFNKWQ